MNALNFAYSPAQTAERSSVAKRLARQPLDIVKTLADRRAYAAGYMDAANDLAAASSNESYMLGYAERLLDVRVEFPRSL